MITQYDLSPEQFSKIWLKHLGGYHTTKSRMLYWYDNFSHTNIQYNEQHPLYNDTLKYGQYGSLTGNEKDITWFIMKYL